MQKKEQEEERVKQLSQLQIIDTAPEEDFDDLVSLAAHACNARYAALAFDDNGKWLFKAVYGFSAASLPTPLFFTKNTSTCTDEYIVTDIVKDPRFQNDSLLPPDDVRFFGALPVCGENNTVTGYLIVADPKTCKLKPQQLACIRMLSKQAGTLLKLRAKIKALKKIEEDYRQGDEQMNTIFQNAIDAVVVIDESGAIQQWNPKAESIFGWKYEEIRGKVFQEALLDHECVVAYRSAMAELGTKQAAGTNLMIEISAHRKNGSIFDIALGISPTRIKGKRYYINFISDITERKQATAQLDKQKEFYENILNQLPTDIAVFDANHKYLFVNPGAIKDEVFRKFIVGKDDFQYAEYRNRDQSVAQKRRDQFLEVKNSGKEIRWEDNTVMDPDGNPITHLRRLFPVFDANGELSLVIGFGIDITDRKVMEEKQTLLVKQLSTQNTQLIDFCNIVSHNLRAPLVNMSMLVDFIQESQDTDEQEMLVTKLKPVLDNLHTTFNELVESIQIKQDLEVKFEKNNLEQCLQRTIDGLKTEISKSEAKIEFNFENAPVIYCPSKYLFSIFHNLVSNSLKYQSPKRPPVIKLETKKHNGKITLSVKDNGLGIDMNKHKNSIFKIGKVFHRHPNAKGFGLFMTRTQVEAMDGKIWAESVPGEGSTFFIEFKNQK